MFERFNSPARGAVAHAAQEARDLGADEMSTGHLLLALMTSVRGEHNKAVEILLALRILPQEVRDTMLAALPAKVDRVHDEYVPFTQESKKALELSLRGALLLGDNFIGPEHLLYGLTRNANSSAGRVLAGLGITFEKIHRVIEGKTPEASPTASRICDVYLPAGPDGELSVYKHSKVIYPTEAAAKAAHPDALTAAFQIPLNEGEFFDVGVPGARTGDFTSWAAFSNYADAFDAAESYKKTQGGNVLVKLMVPELREFYGKDGRGHDVILGSSTTYHRISLIHRLAATAG